MGAGSAGASRIILQAAFDFVTPAEHSSRADLEWCSVINQIPSDLSAAYLGGGLNGCLSIIVIPLIRSIQQLWVLGQHLFDLVQVSVARDNKFPNLLNRRRLLLRLHEFRSSGESHNPSL